jgi:hypothetical protein
MKRNEQMTRAAARAIGLDVSGYEWAEIGNSLIAVDHRTVPPTVNATFAPLQNPGDAFIVESALMMSARYEQFSHSSLAIYVSSADPRFAELGYMASAQRDDKAALLRARMMAVTTLASLCDLTENDHAEG